MHKYIHWIYFLDYKSLLTIIAAFIYTLIVIYTIIKIIRNTENPSKALGYLLIVIVLPVIGVILYFSIGVNYRMEKLYKRKYTRDRNFYEILRQKINEQTLARIQENKDLLQDKIPPIKMLLRDTSSSLYTVDKTELLINGENKFKRVIEELNKAKKHIHIEYYIFADDKIGNEIKDILIKKAKEGVTVRFIYDDFGSHSLNKKMIYELRENGVEASAFYKIKLHVLANRINYRNHRKIIIIDSKVGFIGGINVDDRYINTPDSELYWRDTHMMLEGEAVNGLQYNFITDWNFCSEDDVDPFDRQYFYEVASKEEQIEKEELIQIAASGPDSERATIMMVYNGIIMSSKKRLYLTTPYLVPNETIVNALKYSALSGVDVRILVPYKSDSIIVNAAARAFYKELLAAGVRIYLYKKGFVHAKTIISDENLSVVGSANLDMRSFNLNFEISALVYSTSFNQQLNNTFMEDLKDSEEINYRRWKSRSQLAKFGDSVAKLIAPLL